MNGGAQAGPSSGRPSDVAMVQATDFGNLHDLSALAPLDRPPIRRIFLEGKVRSCAVIVREVGSQQAAQVPFAQDEDVIETLAPDRADEPFREGVLPARLRELDGPDGSCLTGATPRLYLDSNITCGIY